MVRFLLLLFLIGCDLEPPEKEISVQIDSFKGRIEIMDTPWYTTHIIRGKVAGGEDGMKIKWYTDMYWDRTDSSGYLKMVPNELYGQWYDSYKDTITYRYRNLANHVSIVEPYSVVDEDGRFKMLVQPVKTMQGCLTCKGYKHKNGSFMWLWWEVNDVILDSMEIFLMD